MPRLPDDIVECAFYLFPDIPSAEEGREIGGTGFFLARTFSSPALGGAGLIYAVSNRHVVETHGASVIRLTKNDGNQDFIELMPDDWTFHPNADLAIVRVNVSSATHRMKWVIYDEGLISQDRLSRMDVGIGDDVVMIGRFIGHDGHRTNRPSARFGNISMDVGGIRNPELGRVEDSFAVEMRSRTGYSGSPVLVLGAPQHHQDRETARRFTLLLGVEWGQILMRRPVLDKAGTPAQTGQHVNESTGMNGVVPAWKITEMMDSGKLLSEFETIQAAKLNDGGSVL